MIVRPMLGEWELPSVERVELVESRRLARLGVPGLVGDLHQDLGTQSLTVAISGSLHGDERRSELLTTLQEAFLAGAPLPFVADIVESSELEDVVIVSFEVVESADLSGTPGTGCSCGSTSSRPRRRPASPRSPTTCSPASRTSPAACSTRWTCPACWPTSPP